jgi:hypothetical protein
MSRSTLLLCGIGALLLVLAFYVGSLVLPFTTGGFLSNIFSNRARQEARADTIKIGISRDTARAAAHTDTAARAHAAATTAAVQGRRAQQAALLYFHQANQSHAHTFPLTATYADSIQYYQEFFAK